MLDSSLNQQSFFVLSDLRSRRSTLLCPQVQQKRLLLHISPSSNAPFSGTSMRQHEGTLRLAHERSFTFVNLSDPQETAALIAKKVRAQATTFSHADPTRKQKGRHKTRPKSAKTAVVPRLREKQGNEEEEEDFPSLLFAKLDRARLVTAATRKPKVADLYLFGDGGKDDPFRTFPVPAKPWFGWVLEYYRNIHLPPGIRVVESSQDEGQAYINWHLRESMSEPSFFYMQLLNACTPLVIQGRMTQETVLWLRGRVIATLNEALNDPSRMLSISVLLTVASIALHERLYGDVKAALEVHGRAFSRMVSMCGGVKSLPTPRIGLVLLKFTDDVLSATNSEKSTEELLSQWAPPEIREKHPGYESSESSPETLDIDDAAGT